MQAIVRVDAPEQEIISRVQALGYTSVILLYSTPSFSEVETKFPVFRALDCTSQKQVGTPGFDFYFQLGTRKSSLFRHITHVYNNEYEEEKDFIHQRRSGLNQIFLRQCKENGVVVLLNVEGLQRGKDIFSRLSLNKKLCVKKEVEYIVCLITQDLSLLRSAQDVKALSRLLG